MWDKIIEFYQETSQNPRKGEMWDQMRHHSEMMQVLISKIRESQELQALHAHISVVQLCMVNTDNNQAVRVLIPHNDTVEIIVLKADELEDTVKYNVIKTDLENAVEVLKSILLDV